jgi:ABC-type Fe3+ transport system substrate-binding protein
MDTKSFYPPGANWNCAGVAQVRKKKHPDKIVGT